MKHATYTMFFLFLFLSSLSYSMKQESLDKRRNTVMWLDNDLIIMSSRDACWIINPFIHNSNFELHKEFAHDIIVNKKRTLAGLVCQKSFTLYDIPSKAQIWSMIIPYEDNYSITFSPTDEIILYDKNNCFITNKTLSLPLSEQDTSFGISCNYQSQEIMYPSSNHTFTRKSLIDDKITRHSRLIEHENKEYVVYSAFYNPESPHIALQAREKNNTEKKPGKKVFILNSKTGKISHASCKYNEKEETSFYHAQFLPHSSLIAILCHHSGIHFWDYINNKEICVEGLGELTMRCKNYNKTFAFNPSATFYAVVIKKSYLVRELPTRALQSPAREHIGFIYWFLGHYLHKDNLLPTDIRHILIDYLGKIFNIKNFL